ncbi:MAG: DUF502 domain-containing protein [Proteobacteria bacterium]|nr:DUF502 domain-containing protein [Pseudomonadota bacterium]
MNSITRSFRRYFVAGLLVWMPIYITFFVVHFIVHLLDGTLALLPNSYHPEQLIGYKIPGLGVIFTILILLVTGLLVTNFIGNRLLALWEKTVARIPLIRSIHSSTKQVVHAVVQPNGNAFRKVVSIPYPHPGSWSIAFLTSDIIKTPWTDKELVNVFVPTTPNPTSGFLLFVPVKDIYEMDISVEEALRMVISLGVIIPESIKKIGVTI